MCQTKHKFSRIDKQVSTPSIGELALYQGQLAGLILTSKQSSSTSLRAIRLQQRCNLDSHRDDAYTSFQSNLQIWRGRWRRPCVECAFYSHTNSGFVTTVKQLYIQNEGLSEIFWETGAVPCAPFTDTNFSTSSAPHDFRRRGWPADR